MKLNISIEEAIKKRVSVRTYEPKKLTEVDKEKLLKEINLLTNPFGENVRIHLIDKETASNGEKLGTYGVIKGAKTYLGVSVDKSEYGLVAAGYQFENLILIATQMGLGTVWLAATFSRDQFESAMSIKKGELFPAISPIGYAADKRSITEKVMRKTLKADVRKPWKEIFFQDSFGNPLTKEAAGVYEKPLEMLRIAPSASNAQPWRVVSKQGFYHFYETHKPNASIEEIMIKKVDVGIGLSHFHQTALELGLTGKFEKRAETELNAPEDTNYLISWNLERN